MNAHQIAMLANRTTTRALYHMPAEGLTTETVLIGLGIGLVLGGIITAAAIWFASR